MSPSSDRIAKLSLPRPEVPRRLGELGRLHWGLPIAALVLTAIGLLTVRSAASELGSGYFARQLVWVAVGLVGMLLSFSIDYQRLLDWSIPLYVGGLAALLLVLPI